MISPADWPMPVWLDRLSGRAIVSAVMPMYARLIFPSCSSLSTTVLTVLTGTEIPLFLPAEDGIRGRTVTGVQTCALPFSRGGRWGSRCMSRVHKEGGARMIRLGRIARSEERRVGKECRSRWRPLEGIDTTYRSHRLSWVKNTNARFNWRPTSDGN